MGMKAWKAPKNRAILTASQSLTRLEEMPDEIETAMASMESATAVRKSSKNPIFY